MSWFGYNKGGRGGASSVVRSDIVLRDRKNSQKQGIANGKTSPAMGNNISLQNAQPIKLTPASPTLTQPLPQEAVKAAAMSTEETDPVPEKRNLSIAGEFIEENNQNEKEKEKETETEENKKGNEKKKEKLLVDTEKFVKADEKEKLNLLMFAINQLGKTFNDKLGQIQLALMEDEEGVFPRLRDCEAAVDDYKERIEELEETNELLKIDVGLLKGVVQTQERHIASLQEQMTDMKARSMSNNITITGIEEHPDEDCKSLAKHFLTEKLSLKVQTEDIQVAHRIGMKDAKDRQMVVKLSSKIRGKVFSYTKNLKGKKNSQNKSYYVDPQLP